jgi:hypothetical protein
LKFISQSYWQHFSGDSSCCLCCQIESALSADELPIVCRQRWRQQPCLNCSPIDAISRSRQLRLDYLTKVVANFSPNIAIVCINCDDQKQFEFNVPVVNKRKSWHVLVTENFDAALLF